MQCWPEWPREGLCNFGLNAKWTAVSAKKGSLGIVARSGPESAGLKAGVRRFEAASQKSKSRISKERFEGEGREGEEAKLPQMSAERRKKCSRRSCR